MNDFPDLGPSSTHASTHNHGGIEGIKNNGHHPIEPDQVISSAEKLMRQHHQHLSYEEIRQAATDDHQPSPNGVHRSNSNYSRNSRDKKQPDLDSETAFPSLGTPAAAPKTAGGWGAGPALSSRLLGRNLQNANLSNANQFTETLVLLLSSIHIGPVPSQYREKGPRAAGEKREEDPKTLPEVLRVIQKRHPTVTVESSTSRDRVTIIFRTPFVLPPSTSSTPSLIKAAASLSPDERIVRARQELITRVTRKIEKVIKIPASVKPFVIGQRGRVLKEIIELTGANINLPPKDESRLLPNVGSPTEHEIGNGSEEVEMVPITINGEESSVLDAEDRIMMIVREHTNKVNRKITSIPAEVYPLLSGPLKISEAILRGLLQDLGVKEDELNCQVTIPTLSQIFSDQPSHLCLIEPEANVGSHLTKGASASKESLAITISGDRQQVEYASKLIESTYQKTINSVAKVEVELPKRQHKLLDHKAIEKILDSTGSLVILPPASDSSEKVVIRGENMSNVQALGLVVTIANGFSVESLDLKMVHPKLSDPVGYANSLVAYLSTKVYQTKLIQIQEEYSLKGVKIYVPLRGSPFTTIDIAGKDPETIKTVKASIEALIKNTMKPGYFLSVEVDKLLHGHILKKKNPRLKALLDHNGIEIIFPSDQDSSSTVALVASKAIAGKDPKTSTNEAELGSALSKVKEELLNSVKELAEMKTVEFEIPEKLHSHIVGPNRTNLNVIIGEDKLVSVQIGRADSADLITIRGPKDEVDRVEKEIRRMAEEAKVTEAIHSHSTEFEIDSKLVSHLVGKRGSTISKLGEELGVKVNFSDQVQNTSHDDSAQPKKRKNHHQKVLVTVSGRMENVEEAKKRILAQAERLADEVTVNLPILAGLDRGALIGKGGMYITRLQDTYMVHIRMPSGRKGDNLGNGSEQDITIRGPKKGVDAVRRELVELMEYEREQGNVATMDISTRSIARVVGKGGVQADKIREESGIQSLDIDKLDSSDLTSRVTLKGSKPAILAAKKMINSIAQGVDDESSVEMKIPRIHHQTLLGRAGARLREIVKIAGLDESAARLVHFPKLTGGDEGSDVVQIKGDKSMVAKIQRQLELEVERLNNQVTIGVYVPKNNQPSIIGRSALGLKALQDKYNVVIIAPGWSQWATSDQPINQSDLNDVNPDEIFKVIGSKESCLSAIEELKSKIVVKEKSDRAPKFIKTIIVPAQYHHLLSENGRLIRGLPKGVRIDHGDLKIPNPFNSIEQSTSDQRQGLPSTRIDVDEPELQQPNILSWNLQEVQLDGLTEIPWNISGTEEEVMRIESRIQDRLRRLGGWEGKSHIVTVKVPRSLMPAIIGKSGTGLQNLYDKSQGCVIEVVGKFNSDTLKILGTLNQLDIIKDSLNLMTPSAKKK